MKKYLLLFLVFRTPQALELDIGLPDKLNIHGFASQNYIYTTGNNFFGHSTNMGSLDFTEAGINGSLRIYKHLRTAMQILYRRAGATDNQNVRIDFAFLDYSIISDTKKTIGVRAGRVVNPYGFYNDTRDMPFTRPSILLPQSIYFDVDRNFALSGDGIQAYAQLNSEYGDFLLQAQGIYPRMDDPEWEKILTTNNINSDLSWLTRLIYEYGQGKFRLGISTGSLNVNFAEPGLRFEFKPIIFSIQYNLELLTLTSEYGLRNANVTYNSAVLENSFGESYYIQGAYRILPSVEVYTRYDAFYPYRDDKNGRDFEISTGQPSQLTYSKDLTTGIRWDINDNWMIRAEYHYIQGSGWVPEIENSDFSNVPEYWNMAIIGLSVRF